MVRSAGMPAAAARSARDSRCPRTSATMPSADGSARPEADPKRSVRQCIRHTATSAAAQTSSIRGSAMPPETSLIITAPASMEASATVARMVSTLTGIPAAANSRTTGTTRPSSSSAVTRTAPGRVDSPPTSMRSAPSAMSRRARATATAGSFQRPPSEKLSSVTLTMPMTRQRSATGSTGSGAATAISAP